MSIFSQYTRRLVAMVSILLATLAQPVSAADLNTAKANGWACEQANGLLAVRGGPADVPGMVNSINAQRLAEYQRIAQKNGTSPAQVAAIAAQTIRGREPQHMCR